MDTAREEASLTTTWPTDPIFIADVFFLSLDATRSSLSIFTSHMYISYSRSYFGEDIMVNETCLAATSVLIYSSGSSAKRGPLHLNLLQ